MGYYIRRLPKKKSRPQWKVQYVSRKKADCLNSKAQNPQRTWDIPKRRWPELGFSTSMTFDEAKDRQRQLNFQLDLKRKEENRVKFEEDQKKLEMEIKVLLPPTLKEGFEQRYFFDRRREIVERNKEMSHWRTAQKLIPAIHFFGSVTR